MDRLQDVMLSNGYQRFHGLCIFTPQKEYKAFTLDRQGFDCCLRQVLPPFLCVGICFMSSHCQGSIQKQDSLITPLQLRNFWTCWVRNMSGMDLHALQKSLSLRCQASSICTLVNGPLFQVEKPDLWPTYCSTIPQLLRSTLFTNVCAGFSFERHWQRPNS